MSIEERITTLIALTKGKEELMFYYLPETTSIIYKPGPVNDVRVEPAEWLVEVGNPSSAVMLGESTGKYRVEGRTLEEAIDKVMADIIYG